MQPSFVPLSRALAVGLTTISLLVPVGLVTGGCAAAPVQVAGGGSIHKLPSKDRKRIDEYLGAGVVGAAVAAYPIQDPIRFLGLGEPQTLQARVVHGPTKGEERAVVIRRDTKAGAEPGAPAGWSLEIGAETWIWEVDPQGNLVQRSMRDQSRGIIMHFSPPEAVIDRGMQPGDEKQRRIGVRVFDLEEPDKLEHEGYLDATSTYVGSYQVEVPAGRFEAALFRWKFEGLIGTATVEDYQYWFFADGVGPVARIDRRTVQSFPDYNEDERIAGVLVSLDREAAQ